MHLHMRQDAFVSCFCYPNKWCTDLQPCMSNTWCWRILQREYITFTCQKFIYSWKYEWKGDVKGTLISKGRDVRSSNSLLITLPAASGK